MYTQQGYATMFSGQYSSPCSYSAQQSYAPQFCSASQLSCPPHCSSLEYIASSAPVAYEASSLSIIPQKEKSYQPGDISSFQLYESPLAEYFAPKHQKEYHATNGFLKLYRPATQFIEGAEEIEPFVKETFEKTTGTLFPQNVIIRILNKEDMQRIHETNAGQWNDTIQGFSINALPFKQIFIKKGDLDKVLLVAGHEIGHVLTPALTNAHDEEAKAFAFEFAWVETILKHNIANLKENFTLDMQPAKNGLHDVAAGFVKQLMKKGKEAMELYEEISRKLIILTQQNI